MDIGWVVRILSEEEGNWDHLVFLGDYFDSFKRPPAVGSYAEVCDFLRYLRAQSGKRVSSLLGNHDMPYLEALDYAREDFPLPELIHRCSGFDPVGARVVARRLDDAFFAQCRLFVRAHGFLISHAGIHKPMASQDLE